MEKTRSLLEFLLFISSMRAPPPPLGVILTYEPGGGVGGEGGDKNIQMRAVMFKEI